MVRVPRRWLVLLPLAITAGCSNAPPPEPPAETVSKEEFDHLERRFNDLLADYREAEAEIKQLKVERSRLKANLEAEHAHAVDLEEKKVVSITDGDTIVVLIGREQATVRLEGIDAPEQGQPFGSAAKSELAKLCVRKQCELHVTGEDKYGRTLGVLVVDGVNVNEELVRRGYAWQYREYNKDPRLAAIQREARIARRGLWKDITPVAPWEWRKLSPQEQAAKAAGRDKPAVVSSLAGASQEPEQPALTHWLNTKSGVRHNRGCRHYGSTKNGRPCGAGDGRACGICGG